MSERDDRGDTNDTGLRQFQRRIEELYFERDQRRGLSGTYMWFVEEVGELARSLRDAAPNSPQEQGEFADCLAWLSTLASLRGVDLADVAWQKYGSGCPRCQQTPCGCQRRQETPS